MLHGGAIVAFTVVAAWTVATAAACPRRSSTPGFETLGQLSQSTAAACPAG